MSRTLLHRTWPRNNDISDIWLPSPGATEYVLCSCWTTVAGWTPLIDALHGHTDRTPGFRAVMYFDLIGTNVSLWKVWADFLSTQPSWCDIYIVEGDPLFHVKAVAARGPSGSKVVIGSANLTRAGQGLNLEAMAEVLDDGDLYDRLISALHELHSLGRIQQLKTPADADRLANRAAAKHQTVFRQNGLSMQSAMPEFGGPARWAADLFSRGVYLYRSESELELTISVSMDNYRKAGVLKPLRSDELAAGITWGDRSDSLSISLVPPELEKRCRETRMRCGKILARIALSLTGRLWMPREWSPSFLQLWRKTAIPAKNSEEAVRGHVGELRRLIQDGKLLASRRQELEQIIDVLPPSSWRMDGLISGHSPSQLKTLHLDTTVVKAALKRGRRATTVTPALRADVIQGVMLYINRMTGSRLTVEYPLTQVQALQSSPTIAPVAVLDPAELIHLMAECTRIAAAPHLRLTRARLPSNALGAALYTALREHVEQSTTSWSSHKSAAELYSPIYSEALEWQRKLATLSGLDTQSPNEHIVDLMNEAAGQFFCWFRRLRWGEPPDLDVGEVDDVTVEADSLSS